MRYKLLPSICLALLITSCGWQLRGLEEYQTRGDQRIESINLRVAADNRLFQRALKQQLRDLGITIDPGASVTLILDRENTERRTLSFSSTGIPVQYQLIMTISYAYQTGAGKTAEERRITTRRQYDFDTSLVIAKDEEERQLLQEMRRELAARIIANLSA